MNVYMTQIAWLLGAAFGLSLLYELYRALVKTGIAEWDSMRYLLRRQPPFYAVGFVTTALVAVGFSWAVWLALIVSILVIVAGTLYYCPKILMARSPGPIDWIESNVFVGLLFAVAVLSINHLLGNALVPQEQSLVIGTVAF